ncbi:hypothetical protein I6H52_01365 [Corynebacterium urealyticum]|uniref:hypothetical protein n=1 Tax=Corynebacterium urealyticum TaxID=43771 RepID=UPI00190FEC71|nr:hypothetical protein [Corynebacterium urealyticum]QQE51097.1 hypothetical protein I6H52_01365 [Corynebacterium urealyticum]
MSKSAAVEPSSKFSQVLQAAASLPLVKIDRESFLRKELQHSCTSDQIDRAIATTPAEAGVPLEVVNNLAASMIKNETGTVTALSVFAGIPGGIAMIGTVSADVAQYYGHILRIAQKLAYLYSWPDLFNGDGVDSSTESILTLFVGVMFGVNAAQTGVTRAADMIARQVAKKLPQRALTKGTIYPIVKKVAGALGVRMTKQAFAQGAGKVVPVLGGIISGGLTYATFRPMAKRLQQHLADLALARPVG